MTEPASSIYVALRLELISSQERQMVVPWSLVVVLFLGIVGCGGTQPTSLACLNDGSGCFDESLGIYTSVQQDAYDSCASIGDKLPTLQQWADFWAQQGGPGVREPFVSPTTTSNTGGLVWATGTDAAGKSGLFSWQYGTTHLYPGVADVICIQ